MLCHACSCTINKTLPKSLNSDIKRAQYFHNWFLDSKKRWFSLIFMNTNPLEINGFCVTRARNFMDFLKKVQLPTSLRMLRPIFDTYSSRSRDSAGGYTGRVAARARKSPDKEARFSFLRIPADQAMCPSLLMTVLLSISRTRSGPLTELLSLRCFNWMIVELNKTPR